MFGIDRAIAFTLLNRAWAVVAGPISLIFIVRTLTASEQGYYYTINSVLGLQVFFELGLGFVVLQTVSHLTVHLHVEHGLLRGDAAALARLGRLLADVLRWYTLIACTFIGLVLALGAYLLQKGQSADPVAWRTAWFVVVPVFGVSIVTNVVFSMLEGMGLVAAVARVRLVQSLLAMTGLWLALTGGLKLASLVVLHGANLLVAAAYLLVARRQLLRQILAARARRGAIDWRRDIWPFQWRIAISWTAGYLGSQAITPIVFSQAGPVQAGQMGLSLSLMGAISSMAMAWVATKSPMLGKFAAQGRHAEMAAVYRTAERHAMTVALLAMVLVISFVAAIAAFWPALSVRFVTPVAIALLCLATVFNVQTSARAIYLRAFRREPFMVLSVGLGVAIGLTTLLMARAAGAAGVCFGYAVLTVGAALLWCRPIFNRCKIEFAKA